MVVAMLADVIEITASADAQLWRHYLRLLLDGLDPVHARASRRGAKRARLALSREARRRSCEGLTAATQASGRLSLGSTSGQ